MIRKFFAGIFASLFIIIFTPFVFALGAYDIFSDPDFYEGEFTDHSYNIFLDYLPQYISKSLAYDDNSTVKALDRGTLSSIITRNDFALFVDSSVNAIKNSGFENGYYYISLPLSSLFDDKISSLPVGSREFLLLSALPPDISFSTVAPESISGDLLNILNDVFIKFVLLSVAILSLCLLLIGLLVYSPWTLVLRWESKTVFISSLLVLFSYFSVNYIASQLPLSIVAKVSLYLPLYSFLISSVFKPVLYVIVPLFVLSAITWIFSLYYAKKTNV